MTTRAVTIRTYLGTLSDYYELTKPGITFTVVASMLVGFVLGAAGTIDFGLMAHAIFGTWMIAAGTAAHNMFLERGVDGLMHRTSKRPLPDNRLEPAHVIVFSLTLIGAGLFWLLMMVNTAAGLVSLATVVIYLWAYTPLKRISALNVFVGAVPGALPVVGGWAAASGTIFEHGMWILFGIIYCWQIPHVMSIAWVCKKDYDHAGFQMLPKSDRNGWITVTWTLIPLIALLPSIYKLYTMELVSAFFLATATLTTLLFLVYGIRFAVLRSIPSAKSLMFFSFAYLPLVWILIFTDWIIF